MKACFPLQLFVFGHSFLAPSAASQPTNHPFLLPLPPSLSVAVREAGRKREKRSPACHTFHSAHSLTRGADRQSVAQPASQPHATQRRPLAPSFLPSSVDRRYATPPRAEAPDAATAAHDGRRDGRTRSQLSPNVVVADGCSDGGGGGGGGGGVHNETS